MKKPPLAREGGSKRQRLPQETQVSRGFLNHPQYTNSSNVTVTVLDPVLSL